MFDSSADASPAVVSRKCAPCLEETISSGVNHAEGVGFAEVRLLHHDVDRVSDIGICTVAQQALTNGHRFMGVVQIERFENFATWCEDARMHRHLESCLPNLRFAALHRQSKETTTRVTERSCSETSVQTGLQTPVSAFSESTAVCTRTVGVQTSPRSAKQLFDEYCIASQKEDLEYERTRIRLADIPWPK